ncbi:MAG: methionyl-tRNA formyltransferase [Gemmatimonadales bacterium]|nr:methionyl-tRNA formyltransferase [Gemmatimonadales bacterium]
MRVAFFGTPAFAVPSLDALLRSGAALAAVVTQPDRPGSRSHSTLVAPPVKQRALQHGLTVLQPARPRGTDFLATMADLDIDLGVVVAYGHLLPNELLAIPRLGMVNVHASLLPRWRGAAPIHWAVASGDATTGVSIMRVEAGLDSGAVWHTRTLAIDDTATTGMLFDRLAVLGAEALVEALPRIEAGEPPAPQPANGITLAPKVDRDVARIDWRADADTVARHIRAMDPAPGAWTAFGEETLKCFGVTVLPTTPPGLPGSVDRDVRDALVVRARQGGVRIADVQPAGRRRMTSAEWLRGIEPGHEVVLT